MNIHDLLSHESLNGSMIHNICQTFSIIPKGVPLFLSEHQDSYIFWVTKIDKFSQDSFGTMEEKLKDHLLPCYGSFTICEFDTSYRRLNDHLRSIIILNPHLTSWQLKGSNYKRSKSYCKVIIKIITVLQIKHFSPSTLIIL